MGARILVVEDTPHNLQLMAYLLQANGHVVVLADTGEAGVALAAESPPDLVVLDLQLPGIDGSEVLRSLRAMPDLVGVPIIAVTSFAMLGDRTAALKVGFDDHMTKPIDPQSFAHDIARWLPEPLRGAPPVLTTGDAVGRYEAAIARPPARPGTDILVLDDSRTNQTLLRSVLEPYGYHVRTASTVDEAIAAAEEIQPDLILSDVHVGTQRGTELLSFLRTVPMLTVVPFAFITATTDWLDPLVREGKVRIIRRPVEPTVLLDEVEALLRQTTGG